MSRIELRRLEDVYVDINNPPTMITHKYKQLLDKVVQGSLSGSPLNRDEKLVLANFLYTIYSDESKLDNDSWELITKVTNLMTGGIANGLANGSALRTEIINEINKEYRQLFNYVKSAVEVAKRQKNYDKVILKQNILIVAFLIVNIIMVILWLATDINRYILGGIHSGLLISLSIGVLLKDYGYILDQSDKYRIDELLEDMDKNTFWYQSS